LRAEHTQHQAWSNFKTVLAQINKPISDPRYLISIDGLTMTPDQSDYFVFTSEAGKQPPAWSWEMCRRSKPAGIKVSEGGMQSQQAAEFAGLRALSDFLITLAAERKRLPSRK
jgi:hypothetical protein